MIKASEARIIKKPSDIVLIPGMRKIKFGVGHCTSGPLKQSVHEILNYWEKHNGWNTPGYHYLIDHTGKIWELVRIDKISNGVKGHNENSVHFTCIGGIDSNGKAIDNRTEEQIASQLMIISRLKELIPNIIFLGHRDFSIDKNGNGIIEVWEWIKACPGYDLRAWLKQKMIDIMLIPEKIVYKYNTPQIKNEVVGDIQIALRNFGFYSAKIDDFFGEKTEIAVKAFQEFKKLPITGIVDKQTASLLNIKI